MQKNVLVIGSINVDYVIHTERLPVLGETLTGSDFAMNFGGKGANQAVALARAGCNVRMLGAVGSDRAGELALQNLRDFGVDTSAVMIKDEKPTGAAVITVCGGDNHIILDPGANELVTPEAIQKNRALLEWADLLVMQLEIPVESVLAAAKLAKETRTRVILNPAPVKAPEPEIYSYIDLIIPNEHEAAALTGITTDDRESAEEALRALCLAGCEQAIITLGGRGCIYGTRESIASHGVFRVPRVDTTAAGDSFVGGLCARLCEGDSLPDAIRYASATAAIAVSRKGASASIPTRDEVVAFLQAQEN